MTSNPCPNGCPVTGDHACPVNGGYVSWVTYPWWGKARELGVEKEVADWVIAESVKSLTPLPRGR
jgi:hypothetical protein